MSKRVVSKQFGAALLVATAMLSSPVLADSASSCRDLASKTAPPAVTAKNGDEVPVSITADHIEFPKRNVVLLKGYTQLIRGGHRVFADELLYDKGSQSVEARGLVKLETPTGDSIRTGVLHYDVDKQTVESGPASFLLANRDTSNKPDSQHVSAHGTASKVELRGENAMYMEQVEITTCLDGKEDLTFKADSLEIDLDQGFRLANRAKVQILAPDRHPQINEMLN